MIDWIPVDSRVPDDRRTVLVWGDVYFVGTVRSQFLGGSRYNMKRRGDGQFDIEKPDAMLFATRVTHWAEIDPPSEIKA